MNKIKDEVLNAIKKIPDDIKIKDMMYRLYVIGKIHLGKDAILNGQRFSPEELRKVMASW